MAKNTLRQWDVTALNNADVGGISVAEGMSPAFVNDAIREIMGQVRRDIRLFDTRADVASSSIGSHVEHIHTAGYESVGDGGAALYAKAPSEPSHLGKIQSSDGAWSELAARVADARQFGVVHNDRSAATANTTALQNAIDYCEAKGAQLDLGSGSIFIDGTVTIDEPIIMFGRGVHHWSIKSAATRPLVDDCFAAPTQIVLTGDATKSHTFPGVSDMAVSGGVLTNGSADGGDYNDAEYGLESFMNADGTLRAFSVGVMVHAAGVVLRDFRIFPDGGGANGLDAYNDRSATVSTAWADEWDVALCIDASPYCRVDNVQAVGHNRIAGILVTNRALDITATTEPITPEGTVVSQCLFQGYKAVLIRGSDVAAILDVGSNYIDVEYADTLPWRDNTIWGSLQVGNSFISNYSYTITGVTQTGSGPTKLRLTVDGDPAGDGVTTSNQAFAGGAGGGNSHLHFVDCRATDIRHPSGVAEYKSTLTDGAFARPGALLEMSGWRATEVAFTRCAWQFSGEASFFHLHDQQRVIMTDCAWEVNADADGRAGGRWISSPAIGNNTRVTNPAGVTVELKIQGMNIHNSDNLDFRPSIPMDTHPFSGDDGFFEANALCIPDYTGSGTYVGATLRAEPDGKIQLKKSGYPFAANAAQYDDSTDQWTFESEADFNKPVTMSCIASQPQTQRTLSGGSIDGTNLTNIELRSQGGAASDTITKIQGTLKDGQIVILRTGAAGEDITVAHQGGTGTERFFLAGGSDFQLNGTTDTIMLMYDANQQAWLELSRSTNGV